jgi:hypothetical protein
MAQGGEHTHEDGVEHTHDEAPAKPLTGFGVFIGADGGVILERNPSILNIEIGHEANLAEVRRAVSEILMDLQAQTAAEYTVMKMLSFEQAKASAPAEQQ